MKPTIKRISLIAMFLMVTRLVSSAYDYELDGIFYKILGSNQLEVTYEIEPLKETQSYKGDLVIPEKVTYNNREYSVTSIGYHAFYGCSSLTSIDLPESLTSIGEDAFFRCSSLTSINLPNSVTSIGGAAFNGCSSLTSIDLPESLTKIENEVFNGCSSLTSIDLPESVTNIGGDAFHGCRSLTSIHLPESVTYIAAGAFWGCSSLTSIHLPESVTWIGSYSFSECSSLTSINLPESVTNIEYGAFSNCSSLTSIDLPKSLTSIDYEAFDYCSSLTSVTSRALELPKTNRCFVGIPSDAILYVYESVIEVYENSKWAQWFSVILPIEQQIEPEPGEPEVFANYIVKFNYDDNDIIESASITWEEENDIAINTLADVAVTAVNQDSPDVYIVSSSVKENALILDFSKLPIGNYIITVPEGYVTIGANGINSEFGFDITVDAPTGIAGIRTDAKGNYNVYRMSGEQVLSTKDASRLKDLKPGIYIINGKKVAVK